MISNRGTGPGLVLSFASNAVIDSYRWQAFKDRALEAWARESEVSTQPSPDLQSDVCTCLHGIVDGLKLEYSEIPRAIDLGEESVHVFAEQHSLSFTNTRVRGIVLAALFAGGFCKHVRPAPSMDA
jgi:hypothetical protein